MRDGELGRIYTDGEIICKEGEKGEAMFVIQSGRVRITKQTQTGAIAIATLGPGEIFGEMSLFDKLPRSATAAAAGEARVLSIDKKKLFSTISGDPTLAFKLLETMSGRIRRMDENLAKLTEARSGASKLHFNVEDACRMVLDEARNTVKAEGGSVMLLDDKASCLSIIAAFGIEAGSKIKLAPGEGIAGDVMKTGKAELVNNASNDPRFVRGELPVKALLCAPLRCAGLCIGVMNMSNSSERLFTLEDLKYLHSLAAYAAMSIQNARNFAGLRSAADKVLMHATLLDM